MEGFTRIGPVPKIIYLKPPREIMSIKLPARSPPEVQIQIDDEEEEKHDDLPKRFHDMPVIQYFSLFSQGQDVRFVFKKQLSFEFSSFRRGDASWLGFRKLALRKNRRNSIDGRARNSAADWTRREAPLGHF